MPVQAQAVLWACVGVCAMAGCLTRVVLADEYELLTPGFREDFLYSTLYTNLRAPRLR